MEHNTKKRSRWKLVYNIVFFALMMVLGAAWAWFIPLDGWLSIFGLFAACVSLITLLNALEKRLFPKPKQEHEGKQPKLPMRIVHIALSAGFGFFTFMGLVGLGFALWHGESILDGNMVFVGFTVIGVMLFLASIFMPGIQDPEMKQIKEEMKYYGKDERMQLITYKTGFYTLAVLLLAILLFGAAIVVFPPANPNAIPMGILGLFAFGAMVYLGIFAYYDSGKGDGEKNDLRSSLIWFIVALIPVFLMAAQWIFNGLEQMGIVFFVVFVLQAIYCLVNVIVEIRLRKQ